MEALWKLFSFLFFLANFNYGICDLTYDIAICSNGFKRYSVFQNTVLYFRSPNFPKTMPSSGSCNAQFQAHEDNSQLWLIMYNGYLSDVTIDFGGNQYFSGSYDSNNDFLSFVPQSNIIKFEADGTGDWNAHEAVVLSFSNTTNNCPFGNQIINLEENKIIPITTNLGNNQGFSNCTWRFRIESNEILKFVIKNMKGYYDTFQIVTDGNVIDDFSKYVSPDSPEILYYDSSESGVFQITFSTTNDDTIMLAFVSVVKNNTDYPPKQCNSDVDSDNTYTIFNVDYKNGYTAYDQCTYNLYIPENHELLLYPLDFYIENNADNIFLNTSNTNLIPVIINPKFNYYLTSDANDTILNFESDGNIQQAGFRLKAMLLECECASSNITVPCSGSIDITPLRSSEWYCSNLQCNFYIKQNPLCAINYFTISANSMSLHSSDYISININNQPIDNITSSFQQLIFHPNDNVTMRFYSHKVYDSIYHDNSGYWTIRATSIIPPNFLSIINLNTSSSTHFLWLADLNQNDAYTVCIDGNDTLELFIPNLDPNYQLDPSSLSYYNLYDSNNIDKFIASLDSSKIASDQYYLPRHILSSSGCFTIYKSLSEKKANAPIFFRMQKENQKNCLSNNVFNSMFFIDQMLSLAANSKGDCKLTILAGAKSLYASPSMKLSNFSISSNATYSFKSIINEKEYFHSNNFETWGAIRLYIPALFVIIPASNSINFLVTTDDSRIYTNENYTKTDGIIASPSYGGLKNCHNSLSMYYIEVQSYPYDDFNRTVTLNVLFLDEKANNSKLVFNNDDDNSNTTLTSNTTITQKGSTFYLYYTENCIKSNGFLLKYSVASLNDPTDNTFTTENINDTISTDVTSWTDPPTTSMRINDAIKPYDLTIESSLILLLLNLMINC